MLTRRALTSVLFWSIGCACAHAPASGGLPALRPVVERFYERIRWRDYRGAAELVVPDRRDAFTRARQRLSDEKDLTISDYELQEATLADDAMSATVAARLSWFRLPSTFEHDDIVRSRFVFEDEAWLLEHQDAGPFLPELAPRSERTR